jgi:hypothetical protein
MSVDKNLLETNSLMDQMDDPDAFHRKPKGIGKDFVMESINGSTSEYAIVLMSGNNKCYVGASQFEVALWKSREAMYGLFKKIYETADLYGYREIQDIITHSRLDMGRIIHQKES